MRYRTHNHIAFLWLYHQHFCHLADISKVSRGLTTTKFEQGAYLLGYNINATYGTFSYVIQEFASAIGVTCV